MLARGYALKDSARGTYRLSSRWAGLVDPDQQIRELIEQADPVMETIYSLCGESMTLAVLEEGDVVVIHNRVTKRPVRIVNTIGARMPVHATAMGKAIIACWAPKELDAWLEGREFPRLTANTITSVDRLRAELAQVRRRGLAYAKEEYAAGVMAVGACITDGRNRPVGALSILVPRHRENEGEYWGTLGELTRAGAGIISKRLGSDVGEGPISPGELSSIWNRRNGPDGRE
jgi:DNA-binding IclR family transcriptional regulator